VKAFRLQNFRGFEDTGWIELLPLTLLVGPNSTGKSSLLRFLPLVQQSVLYPTVGPFLWSREGGLDFGTLATVRRRTTSEPMTVHMKLDDSPVAPLELSVRIPSEAPHNAPDLVAIRDRLFNVELALDSSGKVTSSSKLIGKSRPLSSLSFAEGPVPSESLGEAGRQIRFGRASVFIEAIPVTVKSLYDEEGELLHSLIWKSADAARGVLSDNNLYAPTDDEWAILQALWWARGLDHRLGVAQRSLREWGSRVAYLGPARESPRRYYRQWEDPARRLDPSGRNLPLVFLALPEADRAAFNELLAERLGFRMEVEGTGANVELVLVDGDGTRSNLIDLGFGFSQVLPIYLQAFLGRRADREAGRDVSVFAVEQPELHLHPRHQAQLADLFGFVTAPVEGGPPPFPCFVETHSEALIDRMGELISEGKVRREDVQVLLFEKKGADCTVRRTNYDAEGVLTDWPPGFLAR
jgi:predicted ATPase